MDDLTEKLRQAEQDLNAARKRSHLDEAAARYQRAEAELKRLEETSKRRAGRGSRPTLASSRSSPD
jgi:hypothetical protein